MRQREREKVREGEREGEGERERENVREIERMATIPMFGCERVPTMGFKLNFFIYA